MTDMDVPKGDFSVAGAAAVWGVSLVTVWNNIRAGLPSYQIGRSRRIKREVVLAIRDGASIENVVEQYGPGSLVEARNSPNPKVRGKLAA